MKQIPLFIHAFNSLDNKKWALHIDAIPTNKNGDSILYHTTIGTGAIAFTAEATSLPKALETMATKAYHANVLPYDKYSEIVTTINQH
jgi:hypothetical protein